MGAYGRGQLCSQALALGIVERVSLREELLGLLPKGVDGLAERQELPFGVAHHLHEDAALPPALAAKAPQDFLQFLLQALGLGPQGGSPAAASLGDAVDDLKGFFVPCTVWWHP
jgi:hypothetical protein